MNILGLLSSTDLSTASITSAAIGVNHVIGFSASIVCTGSPVGTFKLQASNDDVNEYANVSASSWEDINGSEISIAAADTVLWNHWHVYFRWFRVVYTKTSGTGTITVATVNEKFKDLK